VILCAFAFARKRGYAGLPDAYDQGDVRRLEIGVAVQRLSGGHWPCAVRESHIVHRLTAALGRRHQLGHHTVSVRNQDRLTARDKADVSLSLFLRIFRLTARMAMTVASGRDQV
jgi:hypothetical protein